MNSQQFCTFYLADLSFGLEVEKVQEVIRYQSITRVPLAPPAVRGLINLRGQIVPAVDLRRCLELPERSLAPESGSLRSGKAERLPLNVVVRTDGEAISLLVDDVGEVMELTSDCFETPPETLTGKAREVIRGAYKLPKQLLLVLDTSRILNVMTAK